MGNSLGTEQIGEYYVKDLPCLQIELMLSGLNYHYIAYGYFSLMDCLLFFFSFFLGFNLKYVVRTNYSFLLLFLLCRSIIQ